jgi:hypothetical protein
MNKSREMKECIIGKDGSRVSCAQKVVNFQIFIVVYLQFVDRKHLQAALCSTGYRASTVASEQHRRLSVYVVQQHT